MPDSTRLHGDSEIHDRRAQDVVRLLEARPRHEQLLKERTLTAVRCRKDGALLARVVPTKDLGPIVVPLESAGEPMLVAWRLPTDAVERYAWNKVNEPRHFRCPRCGWRECSWRAVVGAVAEQKKVLAI